MPSPLVLLVAPDPELAEVVRDALMPEGLAVAWARGPDEAGRHVARRPPDLVLVDAEHQSLAAVAAALGPAGASPLPVVVLLGPRQPTMTRHRLRLAGVVHKPFAVADLVAAVRRALPDAAPG